MTTEQSVKDNLEFYDQCRHSHTPDVSGEFNSRIIEEWMFKSMVSTFNVWEKGEITNEQFVKWFEIGLQEWMRRRNVKKQTAKWDEIFERLNLSSHAPTNISLNEVKEFIKSNYTILKSEPMGNTTQEDVKDEKPNKDFDVHLDEWERKNNPFYPNDMRWSRRDIVNILETYLTKIQYGKTPNPIPPPEWNR